MRKIIEYNLADAFPEELAEVVNRAIKAGWQPFGSVFKDHDRCYQPLAKYAPVITRKERP